MRFLGLASTIGCIMTVMAWLKILNLRTHQMDFGLYLSRIQNMDYLTPGQHHFQPLLLIFSGLNNFVPFWTMPYLMALFQVLALVYPAFLLGKSWDAKAAMLYLLYFPIWYLALNEFHLDSVIVPLAFGFYIFFYKGNYWWAALCALSMILVKEIYMLQAIFFGILLFCKSEGKIKTLSRMHDYGPAVVTIVGASAAFCIFVFLKLDSSEDITAWSPVFLFGEGYSWLGRGVNSNLHLFFSQPSLIIDLLFNDLNKLKYCFYLVAPLLGICVLAPKLLLPSIPILAASMLSSNPNHYGIGHHYVAGLVAPLFFAFIIGLKKIQFMLNEALTHSLDKIVLTCMVAVNILISPSPISRLFWTDKIWQYGYSAYLDFDRPDKLKKFLIASLENKGAQIIVSNSLNWTFLHEYSSVQVFNSDTLNKPRNTPQYYILDDNRPIYLGDLGCDFVFGACRNSAMLIEYSKAFDAVKKNATLIDSYNGVKVFYRTRETR